MRESVKGDYAPATFGVYCFEITSDSSYVGDPESIFDESARSQGDRSLKSVDILAEQWPLPLTCEPREFVPAALSELRDLRVRLF